MDCASRGEGGWAGAVRMRCEGGSKDVGRYGWMSVYMSPLN